MSSDLFNIETAADPFAPEVLHAKHTATPACVDGKPSAAHGARSFEFTVPGEPVAKGRARIGIVHGHAMAFTPKATRVYESEIKHIAAAAWGKFTSPITPAVPVEITVDVYRPMPKSLSERKRVLARGGSLRPVSKPDADNYAKSVCDALNKVVLTDDSQIVSLTVRKWYADVPRLEVALSWTE